jgi:uncharacterized protein (DUF433 family)
MSNDGKQFEAAVITTDPEVRCGKPCIRGLRIAVEDVLGWLASGMTEEEILADFPQLTREDLRAVQAYAAGGGSASA